MLVGSDTEVALVDSNGMPISAIGYLGGTKKNPRKTKHGFVQEDGVAAEFNIYPADNATEFADNFEKVMGDLEEIVSPAGLIISISPSLDFPYDQLLHPLAQRAGCDPDDDVWILDTNIPPDLCMTNMRTFGGHVHVSWDVDPSDLGARRRMVKAMDLTLGVPSILLDEDTRRRELYGKAGAHRLKMYGDSPGVEWRVASNWWVKSREFIEWTFHNTERALQIKDELNWDELTTVRDIINTGDKERAKALINHYGIEMP